MKSRAEIINAPAAERRALMEAKDLGTWLYRYRMLMFCTQAEMAAELGVGRSTYAEWEHGTLPSRDRMIALCAYHPDWAERLALMWRVERAVQDWHTKEEIKQVPAPEGDEQGISEANGNPGKGGK